MTPQARAALFFASTGHALCHASKIVLAVQVLAAAAGYDVAREALAPALAGFGLAMGIASVPAGLLTDRWGAGRTVLLFLWVLAAACVACALSDGVWSFSLAHAALGAASGLYHPPGLALLSFVGKREERASLMGWHGVLGQAGPIGVPLVVAGVAPMWGWQAPYLVLAALAVAAALVGHVLFARGTLPLDPHARQEPAMPGAPDRRAFALLLLVMCINGFLLDGFLALFPTTVKTHEVRPFEEAWNEQEVNSLILALSMLGPLIGGWLARGPGAARRYAWLQIVQPIVLLGTAAVLDRPDLTFVAFSVFALLGYLAQPLENLLLADYTAGAKRGAVYALKFCLAWGVGAGAPLMLLPLVESEFAASRGGDAVGYAAMGGIAALGALAALFFVRRLPRAASA